MVHDQRHLTLTSETFKTHVLDTKGPVLVDFWATWCGPCQIMSPIIEELARDFQTQATVAQLDVDSHRGLAMQYGIRSIPTFLFFKDGQVVDRAIGVVAKKALAEKLHALVQRAPLHSHD